MFIKVGIPSRFQHVITKDKYKQCAITCLHPHFRCKHFIKTFDDIELILCLINKIHTRATYSVINPLYCVIPFEIKIGIDTFTDIKQSARKTQGTVEAVGEGHVSWYDEPDD